MKKIWIIAGIIVVIAVAGFIFLPQIIGNIKQAGGPPSGQGQPVCSSVAQGDPARVALSQKASLSAVLG